jgi:hypothetical protein
MSGMDIVLLIVMGAMLFFAVGQFLSYQQDNAAKKYFRDRGVQKLLVCKTNVQFKKISGQPDKKQNAEISVVSLETLRSQRNIYLARVLESAVAKAGVIQYPCMLQIEDGKITGKHYE